MVTLRGRPAKGWIAGHRPADWEGGDSCRASRTIDDQASKEGHMMRRRAARWLAVAAVACVAQPAGTAEAQLGRGASAGVPGQAAAGTPGLYANPYMSPYANPFLNPYMAPFTQAGPRDAALYFFAAQSASGGIGS